MWRGRVEMLIIAVDQRISILSQINSLIKVRAPKISLVFLIWYVMTTNLEGACFYYLPP